MICTKFINVRPRYARLTISRCRTVNRNVAVGCKFRKVVEIVEVVVAEDNPMDDRPVVHRNPRYHSLAEENIGSVVQSREDRIFDCSCYRILDNYNHCPCNFDYR